MFSTIGLPQLITIFLGLLLVWAYFQRRHP
jgi:hypothetical protein